MPTRIWVPSPSALFEDVQGDIQGVLVEIGESICWHIEIIDNVRSLTGYTIVQRKHDEKSR